jgi:hypothetical protein
MVQQPDGSSRKSNTELPYDPATILKQIIKRTEKRYSDMNPHVCGITSHKSSKVETTQLSTMDEWLAKL